MTEPRHPWPSITGASIFRYDKDFRANEKGQTASHIASEAVDRLTKKNGRNPGTLRGISRAERKANKSSNAYIAKSGAK